MRLLLCQRMIEIDGAIGGGSVLRVGIGLSAAMGIPLKITNIRQQRTNPGLQAQHLAGLVATAELCDAKLEGARIGSSTVEFYPGDVDKNFVRVQIDTAGSVGLALQPLQLACLRARGSVEIEIEGGGTFGKWAPSTPFIEQVNFTLLRKSGLTAELEVLKHGFYPKGGARARARFDLPELTGSRFFETRGELRFIHGLSIATNQLKSAGVAERQRDAVLTLLKRELRDVLIEMETQYVESFSPGSSVVLWAEFERTILGADALGERGVLAEKVGQQAALDLLTEIHSDATLDRYISDQIVPFLGIYGGSFRCAEITEHIKTNICVAEKITGTQFEIAENTVGVKG